MQSMDVVNAEIQKDVAPIIANAKAMAHGCTTKEGYFAAGEYLLRLKDVRKKLTESLEPFVVSARKTWAEARKRADTFYAPVDAAEEIVKPAMAAWYEQEEKRIQAEQLRLEAEARKRDEDAQLAEAQARADAGDQHGAQSVLDRPVETAPVVLPSAPKIAGISHRETWAYAVDDLKTLVDAVSRGQVPLAAIMPNAVFLGQQARSLKTEMKYPGVRAYPVRGMAAGGSR